ncbi:intein N-terminal splicing region [Catalinimonas alkaloidigena]|uniref:Intein N-terminal splicing region n=1 Tax=Catalinimonas alkaloidigena TaxID=1075417 RepID=A0A1G9R281_9BACT|nr:Hint domain-containing protein [Catalinimonas alkaloidigena]SDM17358.1 intein N-terminal splicing region [Catalinimonas alkaloidigena]
MKSKFALFLFFALLAVGVRAQEATAGMTPDDYKALKTLTMKNIEKDTYVKFDEGYVLDRYEMKPPFVFKFSDGIERKVYLYRVYETKNMADIGMMALYTNSKTPEVLNLPMPNNKGAKDVWGLYIDDIKEYDKAADGFAACLSFSLTKEMMNLMGGAGSGDQASTDEEYEYCFTPEALVTLADGAQLPIAQVQVGMDVLAFDPATQTQAVTTVEEVQVHAGRAFDLMQLTASPVEVVTAGLAPTAADYTLTATGNHPILTPQGKKALADLHAGDQVYYFDAGLNGFRLGQVRQVATAPTQAHTVYNLVTKAGNYLIEGTVVADKR